MHIADATRMVDYNAWCADQLLPHLASLPSIPDRVMEWMAHILQAEAIWLDRARSGQSSTVVWPELDLHACRKLADGNRMGWMEALIDLGDDINTAEATYTNSKGDPFTTPVREILTHVTIHGNAHRGQISLALRAAGLVTIATDYILFVRDNPAK